MLVSRKLGEKDLHQQHICITVVDTTRQNSPGDRSRVPIFRQELWANRAPPQRKKPALAAVYGSVSVP